MRNWILTNFIWCLFWYKRRVLKWIYLAILVHFNISKMTIFGTPCLLLEFVYNNDFILHLFSDHKIYPPNLCPNVYLLINYMLLKMTIFPFKSTVFTFLILATLALPQSCTVPMHWGNLYLVECRWRRPGTGKAGEPAYRIGFTLSRRTEERLWWAHTDETWNWGSDTRWYVLGS